MFSSKEPFNDDPKPWVVALTPDYGTNGSWREWRGRAEDWDDALVRAEADNPRWSGHTCGRLPRPEFARPQHNPTNPILAEIRSAYAGRAGRVPADVEIHLLPCHLATPGVTEAHVAHARRVLGRLAAFGAVE